MDKGIQLNGRSLLVVAKKYAWKKIKGHKSKTQKSIWNNKLAKENKEHKSGGDITRGSGNETQGKL